LNAAHPPDHDARRRNRTVKPFRPLTPWIALALVFALVASAPAADDPFTRGAVTIRHDGDRRELVYAAKNDTGKDVTRCVVAYAMRDRSGNTVESDQLVLVDDSTGVVIPAGYAGIMCAIPIHDEQVVAASFGFQRVVFADGSEWVAPTTPAPAPAAGAGR
jgi:hypothetical protein